MKILSVSGNVDNLRIQSVNGLMLIEEDWVKKAREEKHSTNKNAKKK